jgi:hypothetical protein
MDSKKQLNAFALPTISASSSSSSISSMCRELVMQMITHSLNERLSCHDVYQRTTSPSSSTSTSSLSPTFSFSLLLCSPAYCIINYDCTHQYHHYIVINYISLTQTPFKFSFLPRFLLVICLFSLCIR